MKITLFSCCLLLAIAGISCLSKQTDQSAFKPIIYGDTTIYENMIQPNQIKMGLNDIRRGVDSLELQLWHFFSFSDTADVFVLKKAPSKPWELHWIHFPAQADPLRATYQIQQSSKGAEIWEKLDSLDIQTFTGMDAPTIKQYTDGELAVVEIATTKGYRCYSSECSLAYKSDKDRMEVKRMNTMVETIFNAWVSIK